MHWRSASFHFAGNAAIGEHGGHGFGQLVDDGLWCAFGDHNAAEINRSIVHIKALLPHGWYIFHKGIAFQICDAEDLDCARFTGAEGVGQVVHTGHNLTGDNRFHCARAARFIWDIGHFHAGCFFNLQRRDMVTHKEARSREGELAWIGFGPINDIRHGVKFTVCCDNKYRRISAPIGNRLEAIGRILYTALNGLGDEMGDVVCAKRIAIGIGSSGQPIPANAAPGTGFVDNCNRHA